MTTGSKKPGAPEWRAHWEHHRGDGRGAPSGPTVMALWRVLVPYLKDQGITAPADLRPPFLNHVGLDPADAAALDTAAVQAFVIVLDHCVASGRDYRQRRDRKKKAARGTTFTKLASALAACWSTVYQEAVARCGARSLADLKPETVSAVWRQLLLNGIDVPKLWHLAAGPWSRDGGRNPLYRVQTIHLAGVRVVLRSKRLVLRTFEAALEEDTAYHPPFRALRLLFAEAETVPVRARPLRQDVYMEIPCDQVVLGDNAVTMIETLERTVLLFNAPAFVADFRGWERVERAILAHRQAHRTEWRREHPGRITGGWTRACRAAFKVSFPDEVKQLRRVQSCLNMYGRVRQQLRGREHQLIPIRSRFFRSRNRRFHASDLWIEHVSGKLDVLDQRNAPHVIEHSSPRARWFQFPAFDADPLEPSAPLVGFDVSSSQTQILAILTGDRDLERLSGPDADKSFKEHLAELAFAAKGTLQFARPVDHAADLVLLMKTLWTRVCYGGKLRRVVWDHESWFVAPPDPALGQDARQAYRRDETTAAVKRIERFLASLKFYGDATGGRLHAFFRASARVPGGASRYDGPIFVDPFDRTGSRWNPMQATALPHTGSRPALQTYRPGKIEKRRKDPAGALRALRGQRDVQLVEKVFKKRNGRKTAELDYIRVFVPNVPDAGGRYAIDRGRLGRKIAPFLVHSLDAAYFGMVATRLDALGLPVLGVHDCVYLPQVVALKSADGQVTEIRPGAEILRDVMAEASREWFTMLEVTYAGLHRYLQRDQVFGPHVARWWAAWVDRLQDPADRPVFRAAPAELAVMSRPD